MILFVWAFQENSRILVNYNFNNKIMPALALHFAYIYNISTDANIHFVLIFFHPKYHMDIKKRKQFLRLHQIWLRFSSKLRHFDRNMVCVHTKVAISVSLYTERETPAEKNCVYIHFWEFACLEILFDIVNLKGSVNIFKNKAKTVLAFYQLSMISTSQTEGTTTNKKKY